MINWLMINLIKSCSKVVLIILFAFAELNSTQNVRHHGFFISIRRQTTFSISRLCLTNRRSMKPFSSGCARFRSWIYCHFVIQTRVWDHFTRYVLFCFGFASYIFKILFSYSIRFNSIFCSTTSFPRSNSTFKKYMQFLWMAIIQHDQFIAEGGKCWYSSSFIVALDSIAMGTKDASVRILFVLSRKSAIGIVS